MARAFNDPKVSCCGRDVADCDCPNEQAGWADFVTRASTIVGEAVFRMDPDCELRGALAREAVVLWITSSIGEMDAVSVHEHLLQELFATLRERLEGAV